MKKVAIFDFCETLIKFQTADAFINYVYEASGSSRMLYIELFRRLLIKLKISSIINVLTNGFWGSLNKKIRLFELRGFTKADLDSFAANFYQDRLKPNYILEIYRLIGIKKTEGFLVGIVSGGFDIYINYFVKDNPVDFLISCKLQFRKGKCTGKLEGYDCMGTKKVEMLNKLFTKKPSYSVVYTDSISDLPLLNWATDGVVVSKNGHQKWIDLYNFSEIIWEKEKN